MSGRLTLTALRGFSSEDIRTLGGNSNKYIFIWVKFAFDLINFLFPFYFKVRMFNKNIIKRKI